MSKTVILNTLLIFLIIAGCTITQDLANSTITPVEMEASELIVNWSYTVTDGGLRSVHITDGVAYFQVQEDDATQFVQAYNLYTRKLLWSSAWATDIPLFSGGGALFLLDRDQHTLSAISQKDGSETWQVDLPAEGYEYELAFGNGILFLGAGDTIYAMDAMSGQTRWHRSLPSSYSINSAWLGQTHVYEDYAALSYHSGNLYVRLWGPLKEQLKECLFLAMDALNGQEKWRAEFEVPILGESPPPMVASRPVLDSHNLFFVDWAGQAYLVESGTGNMVWQVNAQFPSARPVWKGARVYIPFQNGLLCLDSTSGKEIWNTDFSESYIVSPIRIFDNTVVLLARHLLRDETEILLVDSTAGDVVSRYAMPATQGCADCITAIAIELSKLYVVQGRTLIAIDLHLQTE
jgi:outer membrane protein assembly factor BamB